MYRTHVPFVWPRVGLDKPLQSQMLTAIFGSSSASFTEFVIAEFVSLAGKASLVYIRLLPETSCEH